MRNVLLALLTFLILEASTAYASLFEGFESDTGECAMGFLTAWQGHELAHNLAAYLNGAEPPHRWPILGGASWKDDHGRWGNTAKAGHIFNLWSTALTAGEENFGTRCSAYGNWVATNFYRLVHSGAGEDFGDFWAYADKESSGAAKRDWRKVAGAVLSLSQSLMIGIGEAVRDDIDWLRR